MGQKHSQPKSSTIIAGDTLSISRDRFSFFHQSTVSAVTHTTSCMSYRMCTNGLEPADPMSSKWKSYMVRKLDGLKQLEGWPKTLSKFLKRYTVREQAKEADYRLEVVLAHTHYLSTRGKTPSLYSIISQEENSHNCSVEIPENHNNSNRDDSPSSIRVTNRDNDDRDKEEVFHELLHTSPVLAEKFYGNHNTETWVAKSFNIKVPEDMKVAKKMVSDLKTVKGTENGTRSPDPSSQRGRKTTTEHKSTTKRHLEKYKNNTFINKPPRPSNPNDQKSQNMYHLLLKYKAVTETIDKHIMQKQNIFNQLICKFQTFFLEAYFPVILKRKNGQVPDEKFETYYDKAITDIQRFSQILCDTIFLFYQLEDLKSESSALEDPLFDYDNFLSFTTSLVFTNAIYGVVHDLIKLKELRIEEAFLQGIQYCRKFRPQDFGISDEFCLNERTIKFLESKGLDRRKNSKVNESHDEEIEFTEVGNNKENRHPIIVEEHKINEVNKPETFEPYGEAIAMLNTLKHRQSPIHQLKTMVKVAELVTKAIEDFYGDIGFYNKEKLDADQTLTIFMYIVSKSNLKDLIVNCQMVQEFSPRTVISSISGYYAITLEACVRCICAMIFRNTASVENLSISLREWINSVGVGRASLLRESGSLVGMGQSMIRD